MADREKVIKGLEYCTGNHLCSGCGYYDPDNARCQKDLMRDALELLKEQRPHLLTLDEADVAEVVWFEARNHTYIEPMLTRGKKFADETADWFRYGRDWRCWSARPTYTQREEEPWDA